VVLIECLNPFCFRSLLALLSLKMLVELLRYFGNLTKPFDDSLEIW
jgi:hypothetical protein